ncbi:SPOR domain-containing protein [Parvularcula lutaonensis]|uniref:SPOR domain-containing protein n=1 Tax=Parvularcula lutaonensis TaxID=491923 RepID=A0ABV7MBR0_9PROT|nr:SPOR domain-containing protein [Parvularcula lutaonensis]GGY39367.1 sporulation protein [Parvularcula lutaonensis]
MSSTVANVNDILEEDEGGLSGFTILAILATLVAVFILVVFYAYRQGKASAIAASEQLPVVAADPSPVAEDIPLDVTREGARQEVYDRVSGAVDTRVVTSEDPARDALDGYSGAPSSMLPQSGTLASADEPADDPVVTAMTQTSEPERPVTPPSQKPATQASAPAQLQTRTAERQTPIRATTTPERPATTEAASATTVSALAGTHVVQVGAFPSTQAAYDHFDSLSRRMGTLLADKRPDVQVAEVNGRTYHRLRIGPFDSKAAAQNYCAQLKNRGQDCLVRGV